jgi:cytochrome c556
MTIRRLLPLAALLATVALIGAGCGSSSSDEPSASDAQSAYSSIRTQISGLGDSIGSAITGASRQTDVQLADSFAQLDDRAQATVERLQSLDVPDDLKDEQQALSDALDKGTGDLADIARAARASDAAGARAAAQQLITDSQQIRDARAAFERALNDAAN